MIANPSWILCTLSLHNNTNYTDQTVLLKDSYERKQTLCKTREELGDIMKEAISLKINSCKKLKTHLVNN